MHKLSARVSCVALLFVGAAAPVAAADSVPSPSNQAATADGPSLPAHATKAEAGEPKRICRNIETTSSRLKSKKICLTREQWRNAKYN
ncbi:MAG TPA: hypothetical protein VEA61_09025 [Allosphingosinicella sp.]|nr:hypothetical protein [Allosphingosinicella sp.]